MYFPSTWDVPWKYSAFFSSFKLLHFKKGFSIAEVGRWNLISAVKTQNVMIPTKFKYQFESCIKILILAAGWCSTDLKLSSGLNDSIIFLIVLVVTLPRKTWLAFPYHNTPSFLGGSVAPCFKLETYYSGHYFFLSKIQQYPFF